MERTSDVHLRERRIGPCVLLPAMMVAYVDSSGLNVSLVSHALQ